MRWYACPDNEPLLLRTTPRPACWNAKDHPDQKRLQAYLTDTTELLASRRINDRPWALRLDVGAPANVDLLRTVADLDNYAYPLAYKLRNPHLVSVWATKQNDARERSYVRIADAREGIEPRDVLKVRTTASSAKPQYKDQICNQVATTALLADGPVRLELSFVIGNRDWFGLWKPTIDALDSLLGRTDPERPYHPLDGRIVELGMHVAKDETLGFDVEIGIAAANIGH